MLRTGQEVSISGRLRPFVIPDVVNGAVKRFNDEIEHIKELETAELRVSDGRDGEANDREDDDIDDESLDESWEVEGDDGVIEHEIETEVSLCPLHSLLIRTLTSVARGGRGATAPLPPPPQ